MNSIRDIKPSGSERKLSKGERIRIFLRKGLKYRRVFLLILFFSVLLLLSRHDSFLSNRNILPIKEVRIESIDGSPLNYISMFDLTKSIDFAKDRNYIQLNTLELSNVIKEESAFVESVIVTKSVSGNVEVSIDERIPVIGIDIETYGCVLLDRKAFVLYEEEGSDLECEEVLAQYSVPMLYLKDSKVVFDTNTQSSFYLVEDIDKVITVLRKFNFTPQSMTFNDQVLIVKMVSDHQIAISMNQSVETQLERFVAVVSQIQADGLEFRSLDLRYRRPVLKR